MNGPYELDTNAIDAQVTETLPGNYALGNMDDNGTFLVHYVGRSDSDVNGRLIYWAYKTDYTYFKFSYANSPQEAFEKECKHYHDFDPPNNDNHPDRPTGKGWICPRCNIFD